MEDLILIFSSALEEFLPFYLDENFNIRDSINKEQVESLLSQRNSELEKRNLQIIVYAEKGISNDISYFYIGLDGDKLRKRIGAYLSYQTDGKIVRKVSSPYFGNNDFVRKFQKFVSCEDLKFLNSSFLVH